MTQTRDASYFDLWDLRFICNLEFKFWNFQTLLMFGSYVRVYV